MNRRRNFNSKTIVFKKQPLAVIVLLLVFCVGLIFALTRIPTAALASIPGDGITPFYKLCINTTIPAAYNGDRELNNQIFSNMLSSILGFDIFSPKTILAGQVPVIKVASSKFDIPQGSGTSVVQAAAANNNPHAATPAPAAPNTPASDPENYPIVEVSQVSGGIRNTGSNKNIYVENSTTYDINIPELLTEPLKISPKKDKPFVLIVHTHTTESYTPSGQDTYTSGDSTRTQDPSKNVVRVGDEVAEQLKNAGINVIHDKTINDYPSYNGSYKKTLSIIEGYLEKYPSIQIVIDVHRDGMTKQDGTKLKVCADVNGEKASQVMLLLGTNQGGLKNDNWRENLKLGLRIQDRLTSDYPRLARPLGLQKERYNMHATLGSMILEVGTDGNTLEEAVVAGKYAGKAMADVISKIK